MGVDLESIAALLTCRLRGKGKLSMRGIGNSRPTVRGQLRWFRRFNVSPSIHPS